MLQWHLDDTRRPRARGSRRSAAAGGSDDEDRATAEAFRRRPVAKDQLADRPAAPRIAVVEDLCDSLERSAAGDHLEDRIDQKVARPRAVRRARRDEDRAIGLLDEPDSDQSGLTGPAPACSETGESCVGCEIVIEGGDSLGAARWTRGGTRTAGRIVAGAGGIVGSRQRLRCQDLPSVATDGA